jgi:hypothetical protein
MPFFTPEQVAQAYIGPGAGYLSEFEKLKQQQAEARKLEIEAAKAQRAEQAKALMDMNKLMANTHLGTGTKFDEAFQEKSKKFYDRWTTGAGHDLYKTDPQAWNMGMQQDANNSLLAMKANYEKGNTLLDNNIKTLSSKYNNAILPTQVKSVLINRMKYKNNGEFPDFLTIENSDVDDLLAGRINADGSEATSPVQQRANQTLFADPELLAQQVRKKYLDSPKVDITPIISTRKGVPTRWEGKIGPYDTVDPKTKKVITDVVPIEFANGRIETQVLSDRAYNKFMLEPDNKLHLAFYEQELLKDPDKVRLKTIVNDDEWKRYITRKYVVQNFPPEQTIKENVDPVGQAAVEGQRWLMNYNKQKHTDEGKPSYINLVKSAIAPGIPVGSRKVNSAAFKEANPEVTGVDYNNLHDITDAIGKADLKNRQGYPVRILKDSKTGKIYYSTKGYTSAAGSQVVPQENDKTSYTTKPNVLQELDPKDLSVWVGIANPQDYGHKTMEDFTQYFDPGYQPGVSGSIAPKNAGTSAAESTRINDINWTAATKQILGQ